MKRDNGVADGEYLSSGVKRDVASVNGNLGTVTGDGVARSEAWGARAADWALVQECQSIPLYAEILNRIAITRGTRLLDVACGSGLFCQMAAARDFIVMGIDLSAAMIAQASCRVAPAALRVGVMEALPYPAGQFDIVTAINALQFASDPLRAARELHRVTKHGGTVVLAAWCDGVGDCVCDARGPLVELSTLADDGPSSIPAPLAMASEGVLETLAVRSGLVPDDVADVPCVWRYPDLETAARGFLAMGTGVLACRRVGEAAVRERLASALEPFMTSAGEYVLQNTARFLVTSA